MGIPPEFGIIFAIFGGIVLIICVCLCCYCCAEELHASLIESESKRDERTRNNGNGNNSDRNNRIRNNTNNGNRNNGLRTKLRSQNFNYVSPYVQNFSD